MFMVENTLVFVLRVVGYITFKIINFRKAFSVAFIRELHIFLQACWLYIETLYLIMKALSYTLQV